MARIYPTLGWGTRERGDGTSPGFGVPCGSWDVEKELPKGPPRLELELWRRQTATGRDHTNLRDKIWWLLLFSLPPVSSQWHPLAEPDRKLAARSLGNVVFWGSLLITEQSRGGQAKQAVGSAQMSTRNHCDSLTRLSPWIFVFLTCPFQRNKSLMRRFRHQGQVSWGDHEGLS